MVRKMAVIGAVVALTAISTFAGKPLKVFIVAGQSNAQGKAKVSTIERLNLTDDSKQMYQDMMVKDGIPSAVKDAYGVYFTAGDMGKGSKGILSELVVNQGPLKPGYGTNTTSNTTFGSDYTFGIYMQKYLNEPILIIKTAWGGRDLLSQFRSPSAGPYEKDKDRFGNPIGHYYNLIIKSVNQVLADPGKYHPGYNKADGVEIAGFVWFQGFNDQLQDESESYKATATRPLFDEYSRLLACFIRDVRKDLKTPNMPFVIGVVGFGGPVTNPKDKQYHFRKAQEAPASLPEFAGNVIAVRTEKCWDMEWERINKKLTDAAKKKILASKPDLKPRSLETAVGKEIKTMAPEVLTPEELKIYQVGKSNEGFHYLGSAYIYGNIGKLYAEAMIKLVPKK